MSAPKCSYCLLPRPHITESKTAAWPSFLTRGFLPGNPMFISSPLSEVMFFCTCSSWSLLGIALLWIQYEGDKILPSLIRDKAWIDHWSCKYSPPKISEFRRVQLLLLSHYNFWLSSKSSTACPFQQGTGHFGTYCLQNLPHSRMLDSAYCTHQINLIDFSWERLQALADVEHGVEVENDVILVLKKLQTFDWNLQLFHGSLFQWVWRVSVTSSETQQHFNVVQS